MKLTAKEEQTSKGKARGAAKAKRSAAGAAAPAKPKKTDLAKRSDAPKKAVKKSGEAGKAGKAFMDTVRDYLREVIVELKKVVWPSRKETLGSTGVILVIVALTGLFLGFIDLLLSKMLHFLVH